MSRSCLQGSMYPNTVSADTQSHAADDKPACHTSVGLNATLDTGNERGSGTHRDSEKSASQSY